MYYKNFIIIFISFFVFINIYAQPTPDLMIEVLNDSLEITSKSQQISLQITNEMLGDPQSLSITFDNIEAIWTLIGVKLNGEDIWLIRANSSATNEKVIAWEYDKIESKLILYPFNWTSPYILEIEANLNLKNNSNLQKGDVVKVELNAEMQNGVVEAVTTGTGNELKLK